MIESHHEHDEGGGCIVPDQGLPIWKLSAWDLLGVSVATIGGVLQMLGNGAHLIAREFEAQANYSRRNFDFRQEQEERERDREKMAALLRERIGIDYEEKQ